MSSEYTYDNDAQFFPFFVLTMTTLVTVPLTYSLLRSPSDTSTTGKNAQIKSSYQPDNADLIDAQRAKAKRKELRLKRMLTAVTGWAVMAYMIYLMVVTAREAPTVWDPFDILDISYSATEKQINSRYRKLSTTMHPDKRKPNAEMNQTIESINDDWVEIVKAYKSLTDEEIRNNWQMYGNPDGKQSTSFGIALPKILVAEGNGKYVLVVYGALLGIGLPLLVGKWWYGMQKQTKEKILVTSAGNMFREYRDRMDVGDVLAAVSSAKEFEEILGHKADAGLGKLESKVLAAENLGMLPKDRKKLQELDDPVRRKTLALLWAYLGRLDLEDKTLEAEKYELAPTAQRLNEAFIPICLSFGHIAPAQACYQLSQSLTQAIPPSTARMPLLQLPHITPSTAKEISVSSGKKDSLTLQTFMSLPSEQRTSLATAAGLTKPHLSEAETVARPLPHLRIEKSFFKVQGEKYIIPSSLVQFVLKARFIPPGTPTSAIPTLSEKDLADPDPADGDLKAQKIEPEQHPIPLAYAPYFASSRSARWHVFLADTRQGKIAVPPFSFEKFDKPGFDEQGKPTFEVVTLKMQFQAPPQPGEYRFEARVVCDGYVGFGERREASLVVEEPGKAQEVDEDDISEPEEGEFTFPFSLPLGFVDLRNGLDTDPIPQIPSPVKWPRSKASRPRIPTKRRGGRRVGSRMRRRSWWRRTAITSPARMRMRRKTVRRILIRTRTRSRISCEGRVLCPGGRSAV